MFQGRLSWAKLFLLCKRQNKILSQHVPTATANLCHSAKLENKKSVTTMSHAWANSPSTRRNHWLRLPVATDVLPTMEHLHRFQKDVPRSWQRRSFDSNAELHIHLYGCYTAMESSDDDFLDIMRQWNLVTTNFLQVTTTSWRIQLIATINKIISGSKTTLQKLPSKHVLDPGTWRVGSLPFELLLHAMPTPCLFLHS
jgi:hypothetical protein